MNKKTLSVVVAAAVLSACAASPGPRPAAAPTVVAAEPVSLTKVYFYPQQGQSEAQQDRDRYECYNWAVRQTNFDPGTRVAPQAVRQTVVPQRSPLETVGAAAAVGAVIGAMASEPGDGAKGAVIGAMAGSVLGSVAANAEAKNTQPAVYRRNERVDTRHERAAAEYRRAMSACLEGRGYSVK
jgi:uncharacterized protein YcfJ